MLVEILAVPGTLGISAQPVPGGNLAAQFLADYLTSDLQGNDDRSREVLRHVEAVQAGHEPGWAESGNAYLITLEPDGARLDFHWADEGQPETASLPLFEVSEGLKAWLAALKDVSATVADSPGPNLKSSQTP